ncbi:MAG TPA: cytochrome c [Ramlibacter sp.]|nr:cytochrome c [Ramlibacter sp.]
MRGTQLKLLGAFTLAALLASPCWAQFARAEDAVKYRQGAWYVLAQHFTRIGAMVNGRTPYDARVAVENAEVVATLARWPSTGFVPGSERLSQKARPEIWTEQARFKEHNDKLVNETARLVSAAKTQNLDQLKAAYASTAATCKSCHDAYRNN